MSTFKRFPFQVPHVRHKKNDGTLYLMGERCGWMMRSKESFSLCYKYMDIKSQKISPEGKAKIQLQIVLHDGTSTTFHFSHPEGQAKQVGGVYVHLCAVKCNCETN